MNNIKQVLATGGKLAKNLPCFCFVIHDVSWGGGGLEGGVEIIPNLPLAPLLDLNLHLMLR